MIEKLYRLVMAIVKGAIILILCVIGAVLMYAAWW
jgi:hypothetical protein